MDVGPYCDTSTGECDVCGGDYPYECNDGCWGCPEGGELCCPASGDPEWCCYTEIGSVCISDSSCCLASTETCNNQDDDCDGVIDNFGEGCGVGACANGTRTCTAGSWGGCSTTGQATSETCNDVDDDCDGSVDESLGQECGTDVGACVKGTQTCSDGNWGVCGGSYVGPTEDVCNGIDDNCNSITDEQNICNNNIVINLKFPENNTVEYINSTPTFGFNITNVNYTFFNCSLWLNNETSFVYYNRSIWINVGTSWNLTSNKSLSDDVYHWWINCTDGVNLNSSEKRIITINVIHPTINSISAIPSPQGFGENVTITANISDPESDIDTVLVEITPPSETGTNYTMNYLGGDLWQYKLIDFTNGTYSYTVYVNDTIGLTDSDSGTFEMYVNFSIQIHTLKDIYYNNESIYLTDPPDLISRTTSTEIYRNEDGSYTTILYSGIRNVFEDGKWKRIEEARSLKGTGFKFVYLEDDPRYKINIVDFNYLYSEFELNIADSKKLNKDIPVILLNLNESFDYEKFKESNPVKEPTWRDIYYIKKAESKKFTNLSSQHVIKYTSKDGFKLGSIIKFGEDSTTIILQDADTENMEDAEGYEGNADYNQGIYIYLEVYAGTSASARSYFKFNISNIPNDITIENALFNMNTYENHNDRTIEVHHVYNQSWLEGTFYTPNNCSIPSDCGYGITWNRQPCGTGFDDSNQCNLTAEDSVFVDAPGKRWEWNVTNSLRKDYTNNKNNFSIVLKDSNEINASQKRNIFYSKEYTSDTTKRPYLNITYKGKTTSEENQSKIVNNGTDSSIYLLMKVQYSDSGTWVDEAVIINDTIKRRVKGETTLALDKIWNPTAWDAYTSTHGNGTYRVYVAETDENNIVLQNYDGTNITASYNFTLQLVTPVGSTFSLSHGGVNITIFDSAGNLFLKNTLTQSATPTDTADDEFLLRDDSNTVVAKINSTGYMEIKGTLSQNQGSLTDPPGDDFLIKDDEANVVARINESGYLFLKGSLYENYG